MNTQSPITSQTPPLAGTAEITGSWNFHPAHSQIVSETHARPSQPVNGPAEIMHIALKASDELADSFFTVLDPDKVETGPRHRTGSIKNIRVKLEKHTEFLSCTFFQELAGRKNPPDLMEFVKSEFPLEKTEIYVLLRLSLVKSVGDMLKILPINQRLYGGKMRDGIDVRSTFIPDSEGAIRFGIFGKGLTADELGRRIQRLMEMETYRTMSLLGLPVARRVGKQLAECEKKLEELTLSLGQKMETKQEDDEKLFHELSDLSETSNIMLTETRYRFAASRAYFTLFQQRIDSLEEVKVGDVQTMSGFLRSRLEPAMATIESTAKRQETLTNDLSRAIVLLRTRIELNLNKGNQELLQSMDKRHDQQLKISQTVEGLSIVAITYYAVGLASYLLKALANQPWVPFSETILTAASVPLILLVVWFMLKRVRKAWEDRKSA